MRLQRKGRAAARLARRGRKLCPDWESVEGEGGRRSRESLSGSRSKSFIILDLCSGPSSDPAEEVKPGSEANEASSGGPAERCGGGFMIRCLCRKHHQWDPEGTWSLQFVPPCLGHRLLRSLWLSRHLQGVCQLNQPHRHFLLKARTHFLHLQTAADFRFH